MPGMNRTNALAVGNGDPSLEHLLDEPFGDLAVLIEQNNPVKALRLGPTHALIQGLGDAEILLVLNQVETERLSSLAQQSQFRGV